MDIIQDVLIYQTQMMRNSSLGPYVPADFSPPEYIVVVNALFYASLGFMILAAFIAMLIKSWVLEFDRGLRGMSIPEQRAKTREFRYLGMERWKLPGMVATLPLLIQLSLLLFTVGLALFLFQISKPSFGIVTAIFGVGVLYYATTTTVSVFVAKSPFRSPVSDTLGMVYRHFHAYFCPSIETFMLPHMDTRPTTALGRLNRCIQDFLQKSRPFQESEFENLMTSETMDEVQRFIAASTLQRYHESVPNSEHSEPQLCSVWQVAGSTALRIPPSFDLPPWILDRGKDKEYVSSLPETTLVALVAVSLRAPRRENVKRMTEVRDALQCVYKPEDPWAQLVISVFDRVLDRSAAGHNKNMVQTPSDDLINMIRRGNLRRDNHLWLLGLLSELRGEGRFSEEEPFLIEICLAILSNDSLKWGDTVSPDIVLLEAVVTLAALSRSPEPPNLPNILTSSCEHPWLLLNLRNPNTVFEGTLPKELISLLFLVLYALIYRGSYPCAVQYFTVIKENVIKEKGDLPLLTSALTAVAPCMRYEGLLAIARMLVAPPTQELPLLIHESMSDEGTAAQEGLLKDCDDKLGANGITDSNIFAILLVLAKNLTPARIQQLKEQDLNILENHRLRLVARVIAQLDIPEGPDVPTEPFSDQPVDNMIAALYLRYSRGKVTQDANPLLLGSFLESREVGISSVALECYMEVMISLSDPPPRSRHLSAAVSAVFNFLLPDHQLWMGWAILDTFVRGFEKLSTEFRETFAEAFFTLSRQPLPRPQGDMESYTPVGELEKILTWEYFHEKKPEAMVTDSAFNGLDWMAMAWSLHLSQQPGKKTEIPGQRSTKLWHLSAPAIDDALVLRALFKLLGAAPDHQIVPIIDKLREFITWFDDTDLPEFSTMISAHIEEVDRRSQAGVLIVP